MGEIKDRLARRPLNMVDCAIYQDFDLEERQAGAKRRLYEYFQVKEDDTAFKWTFSNWEKCKNKEELPYEMLPIDRLDIWAKGWKTEGERWQWHQIMKEANPSDICISTNHMLMVAAIRDDATTFKIMESV